MQDPQDTPAGRWFNGDLMEKILDEEWLDLVSSP